MPFFGFSDLDQKIALRYSWKKVQCVDLKKSDPSTKTLEKGAMCRPKEDPSTKTLRLL